MKVKGFMHVLGTERWQRIALEQIERLKRTGLWDRTDSIFVGSVGDAVEIPTDAKIEHCHDPDAGHFERWTLERLYRAAQAEDCLIWYIHSKGASWTCDDPRWRHHMEAVVIDGHRRCLRALEVVNTCGPLGVATPEPVYAGNFWWARADYVRTLIPPYDWADDCVSRGGGARHSCESWISQANYHRHLWLSYAPPHLAEWREPPLSAVCGVPKSGVLYGRHEADAMSPLDERYAAQLTVWSDIRADLPRLRELAESVASVTEFGLRGGVSSLAFLAGRPDSWTGYDIDPHCGAVALVRDLAAERMAVNLHVGPTAGDTLFCERIAPTDLLMIDSYHSADQVFSELARHAGQVRRFLVFHDTRGPFAYADEDGSPGGVLAGIARWLDTLEGQRWRLIEDRESTHGLQVWERNEYRDGGMSTAKRH